MAEHRLQFIIDAENRSKAAIDQVKGQLDSVDNKIKNMKPAFQKMALIGTAAFVAISAAIYKSVQAYQEEERAIARLTQIAKQVTKATDAEIEGYKKLATQLQRVGVVADDVIMAGQSQIASFTKNAEVVSILSGDLADLAVAQYGVNVSQEQAIQTANIMGKALTGQLGALTRTGILVNDEFRAAFEAANNEQERAIILSKIIQDNYGGLNETMRKTSEGGIVALKNSFGDLQETLGKQFIPLLTSVVEKIAPIIDKVTDWIEKNPELARNIMIAALAISGLVAVVGMLGLVLPSIIAGFTLLLSPVGLLIILIGALTVAGLLMIKNWDKIKEQFIAIWDLLKFRFTQTGNAIKEILYQIERAFKNAYEFIKSKTIDPLINAVNALVNSLTRVWEAAQRVGGAVSGAVGKVFGAGQFGIESVPRTGMYMLHRGESVNTPNGAGAITVNINGGYYLSETVAEDIGDMIIGKLKNTFKL